MKPEPRRKGRAVGVSCIYTLSDEDGVVRYVGQTKDSKRRAWLHGNRANNGGTRPVNHWARRLIDQGRKPILTVVEITADLDAREQHWIAHYRAAGASLLNLTDGGQLRGTHGVRLSPKTRTGKWDALHKRMYQLQDGVKWFTARGDHAAAERMRYGIACSEDKLRRLTKQCGGDRSKARRIFSALIEERDRCRRAA